MATAQPCIVLDFKDLADGIRRREIAKTVEHVESALAGVRRDMQLIGLVQEMSVATLPTPIGAEREHIEALERIRSTLENLHALLKSLGVSGIVDVTQIDPGPTANAMDRSGTGSPGR
jgi:hypothetical protein